MWADETHLHVTHLTGRWFIVVPLCIKKLAYHVSPSRRKKEKKSLSFNLFLFVTSRSSSGREQSVLDEERYNMAFVYPRFHRTRVNAGTLPPCIPESLHPLMINVLSFSLSLSLSHSVQCSGVSCRSYFDENAFWMNLRTLSSRISRVNLHSMPHRLHWCGWHAAYAHNIQLIQLLTRGTNVSHSFFLLLSLSFPFFLLSGRPFEVSSWSKLPRTG